MSLVALVFNHFQSPTFCSALTLGILCCFFPFSDLADLSLIHTLIYWLVLHLGIYLRPRHIPFVPKFPHGAEILRIQLEDNVSLDIY